jgi:hypothetical protein
MYETVYDYIKFIEKILVEDKHFSELSYINKIVRNPNKIFCKDNMDIYRKNSKKKPLIYGLFGIPTRYQSDLGYKISKGTCFNSVFDPRIYNFYRIDLLHYTTYRFGFNVDNFNKESVHDLLHKINNDKKTLCITLIGNCNTNICKVMVNATYRMSKAIDSIRKEEYVISRKKEYIHEKFLPIFLPLRSQYLGPLKMGTLHSSNDTDKHQTMINKIIKHYYTDSSSIAKNLFDCIVDISLYHYFVCKDEYNLAFSCKSGKDRTSIADAINKATIAHVIKDDVSDPRQVDRSKIRFMCKYYLLIGLLIAYYSTSLFGLKLKTIPTARYILTDHEYNFFLGIYSKKQH